MADTVQAGGARWVQLEVFGRRQHFGRLSEVEQFGAKFARVEVFCLRGHLVFAPVYAGAAIFSITDLPGGEEEARRMTGTWECRVPGCSSALTPPSLPAGDSSGGWPGATPDRILADLDTIVRGVEPRLRDDPQAAGDHHSSEAPEEGPAPYDNEEAGGVLGLRRRDDPQAVDDHDDDNDEEG